jgi:hypothetical protein
MLVWELLGKGEIGNFFRTGCLATGGKGGTICLSRASYECEIALSEFVVWGQIFWRWP